ncbi:MAG TPA: class I SAM-dependent methyltransferase [Candidatus Nanoarchaeia archaeon]|nr:class I SAM-dependent methyltransferase [Candidatus Nanoarchaeia archaeon]
MDQVVFWEKAWTSNNKIDEVKLIDLVMHKSAVEFTYKIMGDLNGKKLLEIGCGSGLQTIDFIKKGAKVTAIDISSKSVSVTRSLLKKNNLRAEVKKINAENMNLPNDSFDIVYINCVLMHANQDKTIKESLRVLKRGGIFIFKESLKPWIATFPYRIFSPYMKSEPDYMTLNKIKLLKAKHREFYLFSSFLAFLFYIFKDKNLAGKLFSLLEPIDNFILKNIPFLRTFSWAAVGTIKKE